MRGRKPLPLGPRFFANVDKVGPIPSHAPELGPCWQWTGPLANGRDSRGAFNVQNKNQLAHRVSFWIAYGRWPTPCCLHKCDNTLCVNPAHLFEGDQLANIADRHRKGRTSRASRCRGATNGQAKLTEERVREIRAAMGTPNADFAAKFGVTAGLIAMVKNGRIWRHV